MTISALDPSPSRAVPTISGEHERPVRDLGWTIRPPRRDVQSRVIRAHRAGVDNTELVTGTGRTVQTSARMGTTTPCQTSRSG